MQKLMIASDIHGSALWCRALLDAFEREKADRLLLLGDLLYHGPRNDLPDGYAPKEVIAMLSGIKEKLLAVRGNCDTEVDQMVLPFPILADYALLDVQGLTIFATHGHIWNDGNLPPLCPGDVFLFGHSHLPKMERVGDIHCVNPGSVSLPKGGSTRGYLVLEDGVFTRREL